MESKYSITLTANASIPIKTGITLVKGDSGQKLYIKVLGIDVSNTTAKISFDRPSGVSVESDISATDGVYYYEIKGNELAVPGVVVADLKFYEGTDRISTASFIFNVTDDTMDGSHTETDVIDKSQIEEWADEAKESAEEAKAYRDQAAAITGVGIATTTTLGLVKPDGTSVTIDSDGTIHSVGGGGGGSSYTLPAATSSSLGGVKIGSGVNVTSDGTISVDAYTLPVASSSTVGGVKVDGTSITADADGTIHGASSYTLPAATTSTLGGVIPDGTTITVDANGKISGATTYTLPEATTSTLGGVKPDGTTVTVDADGTIHATSGGGGGGSYTLPTASTTTLGGVKIDGTSIVINNGVISADISDHTDKIVYSAEGVHGLRYNNDKLEAKDSSGTWHEISGGTPVVPTTATVNVSTTDYANKSVTCSNASETLSGTFSASGTVSFTVSYTGNYTITCEGQTETVSVTALGGTYTATINAPAGTEVTFLLEGAKEDTITMTDSNGTSLGTVIFESGQTTADVTLTLDGDTDVTFTSGVAKDTTSGTSDYSKTVTVYVPTGSGYSINTWCRKGYKSYNTLADIPLADLKYLMKKHASADYFVEWYNSDNTMLTQFTADENSMIAIGESDYLVDKLFAIDSAKTSLLASDYWEYILKDKVPTMTSNTAPSGEIIASSEANTDRVKLHAFDGSGASAWWTANKSTLGWLGYKFASPINVKKITIERLSADAGATSSVVVEASNDLSLWTTISDEIPIIITSVQANNTNVINLNNNNDYYIAYRVRYTVNSMDYCSICTLQFYGRSLNVSVPTMTSNGVDYSEPADVKVMPNGKIVYWYGNTDYEWSNSGYTRTNYTVQSNSYTTIGTNSIYFNSNPAVVICGTQSVISFDGYNTLNSVSSPENWTSDRQTLGFNTTKATSDPTIMGTKDHSVVTTDISSVTSNNYIYMTDGGSNNKLYTLYALWLS